MGDGYNLAVESVWGIDGKKCIEFDYNISSEFFPFAKRVLQKAYPENQVVSYGIMVSNERRKKFNPESLEMKHSGFVILPQNRTMEDYPELAPYLEDGELCITGLCNVMDQYNIKRIMLYPHSYVEYLMECGLDREEALYFSELIRKGRATRSPKLDVLSIPEELKNVAKIYSGVVFYDK